MSQEQENEQQGENEKTHQTFSGNPHKSGGSGDVEGPQIEGNPGHAGAGGAGGQGGGSGGGGGQGDFKQGHGG
ncbi:MAG TPA: hypothetical protein VF826_02010 [Chloroflexia bacterium]